MQTKDKAVWRSIAIAGSCIMCVAFALSIAQYFIYKQHDRIVISRYVSLFINTQLFACFIYMIFNPLNFRGYAVCFYVYALGNLLDNGNILAVLFLVASATFFFITDFFARRRTLRIILLLAPIAACLCFQYYRAGGINFVISLMHIVAAVFISCMMAALLYPEIKKIRAMKEVVYLDRSACSEDEAAWLNKVLSGELYSSIAREANVSESTVKTKLLKLYKALGARNKTEFCAMYRASRIELKPE